MALGRRFFSSASLCALFTPLWAQTAPQPSSPAGRPKLVLMMVVDQMRYDYLTRFGPEFTGGLKQLLEQGAVFTNANYEAAPTVTAIGHSTILTGAPPAFSGIAGNTWYERAEGKSVQSITDDSAKPLGGAAAGASPRRLAVSTIGDELKLAGKGGKVFGVSLKDRSAILPAGRMANGAFWFDGRNGNFVSSDYYFSELPAWVAAYDTKHPADKYVGQQFLDVHLPATAGAQLYTAIDASPFADQMVLDFALELLAEEKLGQGPQTDLLSVSFSAVDYVGHASGPDTPRMHEMILNVDKVVGELLRAAEAQVGQGNVLVVFTADHGVSPVPEENIARKMPGGRYNGQAERAAVESALKAEFGDGNYIVANSEGGYYFNLDPVPGKKIDRRDVERVAATVLRQQPHVYRVYTRTELMNPLGGDRIDQRIRNGFNATHSGDIVIVHEPYWLPGGQGGTTHGSPFSYDSHVPVIFWGPASTVKPGRYNRDAAVQDIAPTLATILGIALPSGSIGRVLDEILP
jgi:predicted AlkP superfamily pyrophosphatase or phosphodiesterase